MPAAYSRPVRPVRTVIVMGVTVLRAAGFWLSVALALAYPLAFLVADSGIVDQTTIFGIVLVHLCTLVIGHGYNPARSE